MRILVTGGGGFLGGALLPMLVEAGHDVYAISRTERSSDNPNLNWIKGDLASGLDVDALPGEIDGVIQLAQSPEYRNGPDGEAHVFKVNVASYAALLKYAERAGAKTFVSASTGSIYEPFTGSLAEDVPVSPTGYYGASKLAAEALANAYQDRMSICNLRVFFLYGPGQENMFVARLIDNIKSGGKVTIPAEGDGLVFVPTLNSDTAKVFKAACEEGWSGTYNVANPEPVSLRTLAETIANAAGVEANIERTDQGPPTPIVPSLEKLSGVYDMSEFTPLEDGIAQAVAASL